MNQSINRLIKEKHIKALILDLDGVITQTARVHAKAWKKLFDEYLIKRGEKDGKMYQLMDIENDYLQKIDGIPRYDGVRNFLESRGIFLPEGDPKDAPGIESVAGLGNLKNVYFQKLIQENGVEVYQDTITWLKQQREQGLQTAVISASMNCKAILETAKLTGLFDVRVDGVIANELRLKGKPAPDIFLEAARQLKVKPSEAAIFEDAIAGVKAGKAGKFALVVGINRSNNSNDLIKHGADIVLSEFP